MTRLPGYDGGISSRRRPTLSLLAVLAAAILPLLGAPAVSAASSAVAPKQALAVVEGPHTAYAKPSAKAERVGSVSGWGPIMGRQSVLPVLGTQGSDPITSDPTWLHVRLPGRPNGRTGWVAARATVPESTDFHIVVQLAPRRVLVYQRGRRVRTFSAIIGKPSTPTPKGEFFVEEMVPLSSSMDGAPYALATSARSDVLERFEGGVGQIALHGTGNLSATMGTAASHGCVRIGDTGIRWLAKHMRAGVPITIRDR